MLTMAEADGIIAVLSTVFLFAMLGTFTGALFLNKFQKELAVLSGGMAGLLLAVLVLALAAPYIYPI